MTLTLVLINYLLLGVVVLGLVYTSLEVQPNQCMTETIGDGLLVVFWPLVLLIVVGILAGGMMLFVLGRLLELVRGGRPY